MTEHMFALIVDRRNPFGCSFSHRPPAAMVRSSALGPPSIGSLATQGVRTLRAFGQRVPEVGGLLAQSLDDAVKDRIVMITGASSGIGKSASIELGKAGGTVLLVARSAD